jgi:hypothetical protein
MKRSRFSSVLAERILCQGDSNVRFGIDIAVIVDKLNSDYFDEHVKLLKLRRSVDFRIEPVLIEYGKDKSGFPREVMDTGYILYPPAVQQ